MSKKRVEILRIYRDESDDPDLDYKLGLEVPEDFYDRMALLGETHDIQIAVVLSVVIQWFAEWSGHDVDAIFGAMAYMMVSQGKMGIPHYLDDDSPQGPIQ